MTEANAKAPMLLLTVVRLMPVFASVRVTVALGITASDVSATTPVTFPVACCAKSAACGSRRAATSNTSNEAVGLILEKFSIMFSPSRLHSNRFGDAQTQSAPPRQAYTHYG